MSPMSKELRHLIDEHMDTCGCEGKVHVPSFDKKTKTWRYVKPQKEKSLPVPAVWIETVGENRET